MLAMASDGINDATSLVNAELDNARCTGAEVAGSSAQISLLKGDLTDPASVRMLPQDTVASLKQNRLFASLHYALAAQGAAGVLHTLTVWIPTATDKTVHVTSDEVARLSHLPSKGHSSH
ncbi:MAG: hypothetical protein KF871_02180 [Hydrogenophaga sp.]|uniref:hypothetical protein n=1 Tax=Hydrogenophaga sp. TaxID=1904254 RepID=UPI001D2CE6E6|nr:hypothetical protein [Hydrogenophaga sp.]MBX3608678.1 hypothetical protein [Hydrogenophaga sp.]